MIDSDKPEFFSRLNGLMEIFGKPKITTAAAQVWWDTVRSLDHTDAFTVLGYWAQNNHKPPAPADVWRIANDARTNRIEEKAAIERSSNRATIPHGFTPTPQGRRMVQECLRIVAQPRRREGRQAWAKKVIRMIADGENVPYLTQQIAQRRQAELIAEEAA